MYESMCVCMYICMYVCLYVLIYTYICINIYICIYIYMYLCNVCMYLRVCVSYLCLLPLVNEYYYKENICHKFTGNCYSGEVKELIWVE